MMVLLTLLAALTAPSAGGELDAKLARQWQHYVRARRELAARLDAGREVTREEWQALLAQPTSDAFTASEVEALRARQGARIAAAREAARQRSVIDLGAVRAAGAAERFCKDFPKGGMLHVHGQFLFDEAALAAALAELEPVIRPMELHSLFGRAAATPAGDPDHVDLSFLTAYGQMVAYGKLAPADQARLRALLYIRGNNVDYHGLIARNRALQTLLLSATRRDVDARRRMWDGFLERLRAEHVTYVESTEVTALDDDDLTWLAELSRHAKERYGITLRFLVNFRREDGRGAVEQAAPLLTRLRAHTGSDRPVLGVSLMGNEGRQPLFQMGSDVLVGLLRGTLVAHRTIHAGVGTGEGDLEIRDALVLGAERLGHAVELRDDPVLLEQAARLRLPVESALVSNSKLGFRREASAHPFLDLLRLGLRVSLSTDNDALFLDSPNRECALAVAKTDVQYAELRAMTLNSIATAFVDARTKAALERQVLAALADFERRWARGP